MDGIPICPTSGTICSRWFMGLPRNLPASVNLRPKCPPIEDQRQLGSCTANALVGALEFLELKDGVPFMALSRLFVYYNERVIENTVMSNSGAQLRDGSKRWRSRAFVPRRCGLTSSPILRINRPRLVTRTLPSMLFCRINACRL